MCFSSFSIIGELQTPLSSIFRWFFVLEAIKIWCILKTFRSFQLKTINFQWKISTFQWEISVTFRNRGSNTKNHLKIELGGGKYFPMVENLRMVACDPLEHSRTHGGFAINTQYTHKKNFHIFFRYTGISVVTLDLTMICVFQVSKG